ncbi:hypothetical protein JKP88DRAFT_353656 [Tribonema minus]|uniref:Uncharacterized protein n=1 Tax=Tribonema minus TaxID=303371 RepID=A0A836CLE9_9STRA|nr:hypothetical protein JKP88DRAFT_353656 [Tribonema minus]
MPRRAGTRAAAKAAAKVVAAVAMEEGDDLQNDEEANEDDDVQQDANISEADEAPVVAKAKAAGKRKAKAAVEEEEDDASVSEEEEAAVTRTRGKGERKAAAPAVRAAGKGKGKARAGSPKEAQVASGSREDPGAWANDLFLAIEKGSAPLLADCLRKLLPTEAKAMGVDDPILKAIKNGCTRLQNTWTAEVEAAQRMRKEGAVTQEPVKMGGALVPPKVFAQMMNMLDRGTAKRSSSVSQGWAKRLTFNALTIGSRVKLGAMSSLKRALPMLEYLDATCARSSTSMNYEDTATNFPNLKGLATACCSYGSHRKDLCTLAENFPNLQCLSYSNFPNLQCLSYSVSRGYRSSSGELLAEDIVTVARWIRGLRKLHITGFDTQPGAHAPEEMREMMVALATNLPELTHLDLNEAPIPADAWRAFLAARREAGHSPLRELQIYVAPLPKKREVYVKKTPETVAAEAAAARDPVQIAKKKAEEEELLAARCRMVPGAVLRAAFAAEGSRVTIAVGNCNAGMVDEDGAEVKAARMHNGLVRMKCLSSGYYRHGAHGCLWMMT